jgi:hypothetical protein
MSYTFFETWCAETSVWKREYFGFLRPMVLTSAIFTSLCRAVAEAPIEQAKVMRQTGRQWQWSSLYRGVTAQTGRTTAMLVLIFVPYDVRRADTRNCLTQRRLSWHGAQTPARRPLSMGIPACNQPLVQRSVRERRQPRQAPCSTTKLPSIDVKSGLQLPHVHYPYCHGPLLLLQVARRKSSLFDSLAGQFLVVTSVCGFAYALAWPLETIKNCAQAGLPRPGAGLAERLVYLGGPLGLYRGAAPGILCGGLRNGCAMLAMNGIANPLMTRMGLRGRREKE